MPRTLNVDWDAIKTAISAGLTYEEASRRFNVSQVAIRKRASRQKWPTQHILQKQLAEIQARKEAAVAASQGERVVTENFCDTEKAGITTESVSKSPVPVTKDVTRHVTPTNVAEIVAETWAERGERHRKVAFDMASKALVTAAKDLKPPKNWKDVEIADKIARRASGLDDQKAGNNMVIQLGSLGMGDLPPAMDVEMELMPEDQP